MIVYLTIASLLATIKSLLLFILYLILSVIVIYLVLYIVETLSIRRGYFYELTGDERLKKFGINKRLFLKSKCVGYVKKKKFTAGGHKFDNGIYIKTNLGTRLKGYVRIQNNKAEIWANENLSTGSSIPYLVGYVNADGEVYKYLKDDQGNIQYGQESLIGTCETPEKIKRENEPGEGDNWFNVIRHEEESVYIQIKDKKPCKDGTFSYFLWNDLLLWKRLYVYLAGEHAEQGWGYGFCRENGRWWPFGQEGASIKLILKAGAALLLYEEGYLCPNEDERAPDEKLGWIPTSVLSLLVYLLVWPTLYSFVLSKALLFPAAGSMLSGVLTLILCYVAIWGVIHLIRRIILQGTTRFDNFLHTMNCMTGVKGLTVSILVISILGLVYTIFIENHHHFSIFFCIAIAMISNMIAYKNTPWYIAPFKRKDRENEQKEEKKDGEEQEQGEDDQLEEGVVVRNYAWTVNNAFSEDEEFSFKLKFKISDIEGEGTEEEKEVNSTKKGLRDINPSILGDRDYQIILDQLYQKELEKDSYGEKAFMKLKPILDSYSQGGQSNEDEYDKISLIMNFVQEPNIVYAFDNDPNQDLYKHFESVSDINLSDYWRFPSETLYDKVGDCECKSILAYYLLKKAECDVVFLIMTIKDADSAKHSGHAAIGVRLDNSAKINSVQPVVTHNGKNYYFCETTSKGWTIGVVPCGVEDVRVIK